jgi:hypothetical protein
MVCLGISAWTIADSPKPSISAQVISQAIDPVISRACPMASVAVHLRPARYQIPLEGIPPVNPRRRRAGDVAGHPTFLLLSAGTE